MPPVNLNLSLSTIRTLDAHAATAKRSRSNLADLLLAQALGIPVDGDIYPASTTGHGASRDHPNPDLSGPARPDPRKR